MFLHMRKQVLVPIPVCVVEVGGSPHQQQAILGTPAGGPIIQLNHNTIYPKIASIRCHGLGVQF